MHNPFFDPRGRVSEFLNVLRKEAKSQIPPPVHGAAALLFFTEGDETAMITCLTRGAKLQELGAVRGDKQSALDVRGALEPPAQKPGAPGGQRTPTMPVADSMSLDGL